MCGLAAVLMHPQERSAAEWQQIRDLFTQTLLHNQERGREAAGVALIATDGSCRLYKQPGLVSALVQTADYQAILSALGPTTTCLLGHTRLPTKGTPLNNANNHPLWVGKTVGIHNGYIRNDDELFARLGLYPRQAEVDSEIIFRLLDQEGWATEEGVPSAAARQQALLLDGTFATLSVNLCRPSRLLALKHACPLCLHYERGLQALFFSSRYIFLRRAFGRSVVTEALSPDHGFTFDALDLPVAAGQPRAAFALDFSGGDRP